MKYYIYENWRNNKAFIHLGDCSLCKDGTGRETSQDKSTKHGQWLGPFENLQVARRKAEATGRKSINECKFCVDKRERK